MLSPCCNAPMGLSATAAVQKCLGCGREFTDAFLNFYIRNTGISGATVVVPYGPPSPLKQTSPKFKEGDKVKILHGPHISKFDGREGVVAKHTSTAPSVYELLLSGEGSGWCFEEAYLEAIATTKEKTPLDAILPKFNGEEKCDVPRFSKLLFGAPVLPWFGDGDDPQTENSKRQIKRWTATNLHSWPICRFSRQPLDLHYFESGLPGDVYGGSYCNVRFYCKECNR